MASILPEKLKVLHTADWHICNEKIEDAARCLDFMCKHVERLAEPVELIVVSGDVYNHRQIQQETESARLAFKIVRRLSKCAPVVILTGTPSHDGNAPLLLDGNGEDYQVIVVNTPKQLVLHDLGDWAADLQDLDGNPNTAESVRAIISCTPAFTKQFFESGSDIATSDKEIADSLAAIFAGFGSNVTMYRMSQSIRQPIPHILLGHYSVGGAFIHPDQPMTGRDIEVATEHLALADPTIVCLGHIHASQQVRKNIFYSGGLFATNFGEYEDKGFYIHTLDMVDMGHHWEVAKSEFILTPSPKLVKLNVDLILNPVEDETTLLQAIMMVADKTPALDLDEGDARHVVCRMEIRVYQDEADKIDQEAINEYFKEAVGSFELSLNRIPRPNVRSARIMEADRLREKVKVRSDIVNNPVPEGVFDKADYLQGTPADVLVDTINTRINERKEELN